MIDNPDSTGLSYQLNTLLAAQHVLQQANSSDAVIAAVRTLLSALYTSAECQATPATSEPVADALLQQVLKSRQLQVSRDEHALIAPLLVEGSVCAVIRLTLPRPITMHELTTVTLLAQLANQRLLDTSWILPVAVYRQLVENANVPIDVADGSRRIIYANKAAAALYGYEDEHDMQGKHISDFYADSTTPDLIDDIRASSENTDGWSGRIQARDRFGYQFPVRMSSFAIRDQGDGRLLGWGAIKQDISEQETLTSSLEIQARRLRAATEIARVCTAQLDLDVLLKQAAAVTQHLFGFAYVAILLIDRGHLVMKGIHTPRGPLSLVGQTLPIDEHSLTGFAALHDRAVVVKDVSQDARYRYFDVTPDLKSEMVVPMHLGGTVIGTLGTGSDELDSFTSADVETFQLIADQLAIAVQNARLFAAERSRVQQLAVVNEISRLLVASSFNINALWDAIYNQIETLFDVSTFFVLLHDPAADSLRFALLVDDGEVINTPRVYPVGGLSEPVIRTGKSLRFDDLHAEQARLAELNIDPRSFVSVTSHTRSWLGVPLRSRENIILGLIGVQSYQPGAFTAADERLLTTIATQVSLALHNSNLFTQLQIRSQRLESLYRLSTVLSSSLDREIVLAEAAQHIVQLMNVDHCGIVLIRREDEYGEVIAEYPLRGGRGQRLPLLDNPFYEMHKSSDVILYYPDRAEPSAFRDQIRSQGIKTMLVMRMQGKDHLLGSIGLDTYDRERHYSEDELDICRAMVRQVALTIENTDLYSRALVANELKSQFLATMSHELRTPMNAIIGYTEMILAGIYGPISEVQQDRLRRVYANGKNLLELINDILDLSKIESGHVSLDLESVDVTSVVLGAIGNVAPIAEAKQLTITTEIRAPLPRVMADSTRLRQVMLNLLSNAVKFTREGGITVRVYPLAVSDKTKTTVRRPILPIGRWLAITVEDTGIGIDDRHFDLIFDAFRQIDGSFTREVEGTGLGLAITKQLVEMHRGHVLLESELGRGSIFTVLLPALLED